MKKIYLTLGLGIALAKLSHAQDVNVPQGSALVVHTVDNSIGVRLFGRNMTWDTHWNGGYMQMYGSYMYDDGGVSDPGVTGLHFANGANLISINTGGPGTPVGIRFNSFGGVSWFNSGNLGVGLQDPKAMLHVSTAGTSSSPTTQFSGDMIIQGKPGNRTATTGASLEFNIPANTDGTNPWGQARIITVAGNTNNQDATGKLILGTRRMFDKGTGSGTTWNYGDDLVIDGSGRIGIGTTSPDQKFTVNGTVHAKQVLVDNSVPTPDYVFEKGYKLRSLEEVNRYVSKYKHLPDVASAQEMDGKAVNLNQLNMQLLQKVEELTLYIMKQNKQLQKQAQRITRLEKEKQGF